MGFLFDLIADSASELAKKAATEKGKKIAMGAGIAAATGIGAAATGALLKKKRKGAQQPEPQQPEPQQQAIPPSSYQQHGVAQISPAVQQVATRPGPPVPPSFSFYAMIENVQRGPYNEMQFKRLVDNDLANAETLVWQEGMDEWKPACEVKMMQKIFPQFQQAAPAMPQMQQSGYFVSVNNQSVGPFTIQQLQQFAQTGDFKQDMFVWREGMAQWQVAGSVVELASIFAPQMPTMPHL